MTNEIEVRTYSRRESATFRKTAEQFGGLSNMAPGYPLNVTGVTFLTSEALYQACRFPHKPEVQKVIIAQRSPMTAKMKGKPYRKDSRPDWFHVRVRIMRWCLQIKLAQHWDKFSQLLLSTGDQPIVEDSRKDDFWGAKAQTSMTLVGKNVLGRLLMGLREDIKQGKKLERVEPIVIPNFLLYSEPITLVNSSDVLRVSPTKIQKQTPQPSKSSFPLFEYSAVKKSSGEKAHNKQKRSSAGKKGTIHD